MNNYNVDLSISLNSSKFSGYQSKSGYDGKIKLFISSIWKDSKNEENFIINLSYVYLLERICIERAFNKIKIKNRCTPCKLRPIVSNMINYLLVDKV
jgi:hypothetical protein